MHLYFNEASIQGQFNDDGAFKPLIEALLAARARSPAFAAMRTTPALADRPVSHERSVRQVVQGWKGSPIAGAFLGWVGRNGPFIDDDRLPEPEDLFHCLGIEITDGGLGEAGRRLKAGEDAATLSFTGGEPDFGHSPLPVIHGFEDQPIAVYNARNFLSVEDAVTSMAERGPPATTWQEMVEAARIRFPKLHIPDTVFQDRRLSREPFDAVIRDRFYALSGHLDAYMRGRNMDGSESPAAQEILQAHFHGDRALFSGESPTNQRDHESDMTFTDPDTGDDVLAHWHGKISHRTFRMHFNWPVPANAKRLKIFYIGPKLTKT